VARLRESGIAAGVNVMPILPEITDDPEELDSLFAAARLAGALFVATNVLFLNSAAARSSYLHLLTRHFPHLTEKFKNYTSSSRSYESQIESLCRRLRLKYQLAQGQESQSAVPRQRELFVTCE